MKRANTTTHEAQASIREEGWTAAEAAQVAARTAEKRAFMTRAETAHAISDAGPEKDRGNWPLICKHPTVAPLVDAEEAARAASKTADMALVKTPAPDWRAWAVKFQIVREACDDLLNPLDPRDRTAKHRSGFGASRLAADLMNYALGAHCGLLDSRHVAMIPAHLADLAKQEGHKWPEAFAELQADAERLAKGEATPQMSPSAAAWYAARDAYRAAKAASDLFHDAERDRADPEGSDRALDAVADALERWESLPPPTGEALAEVMVASLLHNGFDQLRQTDHLPQGFRDLLDGGDVHEVFAARFTLHALRLLGEHKELLGVAPIAGLYPSQQDHRETQDWLAGHRDAKPYAKRRDELVDWWRVILSDPAQRELQPIVGRENCRAASDATRSEAWEPASLIAAE